MNSLTAIKNLNSHSILSDGTVDFTKDYTKENTVRAYSIIGTSTFNRFTALGIGTGQLYMYNSDEGSILNDTESNNELIFNHDGFLNYTADFKADGNLETNQYLKVNAWSGYGSGSALMWYDNTSNIQSVKISNVKDMYLGSNKVWHGENFNPDDKLTRGYWTTNGGQDLLVHGKRALVGFTSGQLHLGYGGDFSDIRCGNNYTVWHSGNFNPSSKSDTGHTHSYIPTSASCNKNWNWSGQSGQPSWLWGGNDGTNMYVYNPSNFSVNYANSAGSADNSTKVGGKKVTVSQTAPGSPATGDIWISW